MPLIKDFFETLKCSKEILAIPRHLVHFVFKLDFWLFVSEQITACDLKSLPLSLSVGLGVGVGGVGLGMSV